jgi:hypothetical protein
VIAFDDVVEELHHLEAQVVGTWRVLHVTLLAGVAARCRR